MNVSNLRQQSPERLDLLAPLLAPAETDRCEAIGAEFIERGICHERQPDHSGPSTSSTGLNLLHSLMLSLIERGATLAKLPRDRFANRQLGLDLRILQEFQEKPDKDPELLLLVLHRFQSRAYYWSEVEQLLLQRVGKEPTAG